MLDLPCNQICSSTANKRFLTAIMYSFCVNALTEGDSTSLTTLLSSLLDVVVDSSDVTFNFVNDDDNVLKTLRFIKL